MTETTINPLTQTTVPATAATVTGKQPVIDQAINAKVNAILGEQNSVIMERAEVLRDVWVARVAQQHLLMLGPGGTGKSMLARDTAGHIDGAKYFEVAVDETTDPSQLFGPPDIKAMVEDGKTRRIPTGMLPEATDAFIDEFFNANGPLLHSVMPILNERVFHNNGLPSACPLRQCLAGTNKLNADADQAALWDRIHIRHVVDYVKDRDALSNMIGNTVARMAESAARSGGGRGTSTMLAGQTKTLVTLDELDQAHIQALSLDIPDPVLEQFHDIRDELRQGPAKIQISDRRAAEGMVAVMANAWLNNHESVTIGDLSILANMWWTVQDQAKAAREVILAATNPGEKAAMDMLDTIDKLVAELKTATDSEMDPSRKKRLGVELVKNTNKVLNEGKGQLAKALAAGTATTKLEEVIKRADAFNVKIGKDVFGLNPNDMQSFSSGV